MSDRGRHGGNSQQGRGSGRPAESAEDAVRRQELKGYLGAIVSDLRQWVEWSQATGAVELPAAPPVVQTPPQSRAHGQGPQQRPPQQHQPQQPQQGPPAESSGPGGHGRPQRPPAPPQAPPASSRPQNRRPGGRGADAAAAAALGRETLDQVRDDLGICTRCVLCQGRKNIVFGVGNPSADLVIVGEAPGRHEDMTGEPFVGRVGALLNRMLESIGLERSDVYICNVIKCRPPSNRAPEPQEVATCSPFMQRQIASIAPRAILTVGRFASMNIMAREATMGELRREPGSMGGIPVVATYHPADLLRTPADKAKTWEDLLRLRRLLHNNG